MLKLTLPYPPTINTYWRYVGSRVLISRRGRNYRKKVMEYLQSRDIEKLTGPLSINIELYTPDRRRRDIDNVLKAMLDALQWGGVFEDDNQIFRLAIEKILPEVKPKGKLKRRTKEEMEAGVELLKRFEGEALVWLTQVETEGEPKSERVCLKCDQPFLSTGSAINVGLYSAGLKKRDTNTSVLVAGIQSVYKRACDLDPFDLIVVDEAHLISKKGDGMYRQFLADCKVINPNVRVIGLTATPFRLDSGMICSPDHFLNSICYEIGIKELIHDGYLCPLVSKAGVNRANFGDLRVRAGEFVTADVEQLAGDDALVSAACAEIVDLSADRRAVLIFASSVAHGRQVVEALRDNHDIECGFVTGQTPADERDDLLARFRGDQPTSLLADEPLRFLCNVNVLTTGFDAPRVDCVVMLRPTMSPGLLYQCVGRGFRLHPDKQNCLVLDFGGNIERHGPIDQIKPKDKALRPGQEPPAKECEKCHALVACGYANCPECGHPFPPPDREAHDAKASEAGVLSGEVTDTDYDVQDVIYRIHRKRDADEDAPRCLRVDYMIGLDKWQSEFICIEHAGYARRKAEAWWSVRCLDPCPTNAEEALDLADAGLLAAPETITVRSIAGQKYDRIIKQTLGEITNAALEEAPF